MYIYMYRVNPARQRVNPSDGLTCVRCRASMRRWIYSPIRPLNTSPRVNPQG